MTEEDGQHDPDLAVVCECQLADPPEKVWRALTRPEIVAEWLMPNDMGAAAGDRFALKPGEPGASAISCEVLAAEPPRLLRYSWSERDPRSEDGELRSVVTFVLRETEGGGTHLRIVHGPVLAAGVAPLSLRAVRSLLPPHRREPRCRTSRRQSRPTPRLAARARLRQAA